MLACFLRRKDLIENSRIVYKTVVQNNPDAVRIRVAVSNCYRASDLFTDFDCRHLCDSSW